MTSISKKTLHAINASEHSVRLSDGSYAAGFEVVHYLHCLSFLRQATYVEYYKDKALPWIDSKETVRIHLGLYSSIFVTLIRELICLRSLHRLCCDIEIYVPNPYDLVSCHLMTVGVHCTTDVLSVVISLTSCFKGLGPTAARW